MPRFEYKIGKDSEVQLIDAADFTFVPDQHLLVFLDANRVQVATFFIEAGAYVKRVKP